MQAEMSQLSLNHSDQNALSLSLCSTIAELYH